MSLGEVAQDVKEFIQGAEDGAEKLAAQVPAPVKADIESLFVKFVTTFATHSTNTVVKVAAEMILAELGLSADPGAPVASVPSDPTTPPSDAPGTTPGA